MATGLAQLVEVKTAATLEVERKAAFDREQNSPVITGLAAHVEKRWASAKTAKLIPEQRLLQCLRQRNGEYDPQKLAEIRNQGGSEIFMMLTSTKCRGASSWLRDALLGSGADKPWTLDTTPIPDLPPEVIQLAHQELGKAVQAIAQQTGQMPPPELIKAEWERMRDSAMRYMHDEARKRMARMEMKMEDQLVEGFFVRALSDFLDDIVTFPTAILKGPVPRKRKTLEWKGKGLVPVEKIVLEWERVDPFMCYPAAWATSPQDGPFIERHKFTREDLEGLIGVDGYSETALREVLANFGPGKTEGLAIDREAADATGKPSTDAVNSIDTVDGLQLWDSVQGKLLTEWGSTDKVDPEKSYPCEIIKIGNIVVKAVLNYDPLGRKPYYTASYEKIPGAFWGNGVADLIRDCQAMCNAAARALSNNMGLASGPMVGVNVSRLPQGESITQVYPWKIFQFANSDYQDASKPIDFFQPQSNAQELMAVFDRFQTLSDEYSGIPRYMTGENTPGAGRTASGLSMMISNASKSIKSVISAIDQHVLTPLLERLYQHNLRYSQDPDLIGDVNVHAKGAMSLVAKESATVRRTEFLQLVLTNPAAQQIVGMEGAAELLRDHAKLLDMNVDKIVPTPEALKLKQQQAQQQMQQQQQQQIALQKGQEGQEQQQRAREQGMQNQNQAMKARNQQMREAEFAVKMNREMQPDGSPAGGRAQNTHRNVVTGTTG